jgi:hypothetical protein
MNLTASNLRGAAFFMSIAAVSAVDPQKQLLDAPPRATSRQFVWSGQRTGLAIKDSIDSKEE